MDTLPQQRTANFAGSGSGFDGGVMRVKAAHKTDRDEFVTESHFRFENLDSVFNAGRQRFFAQHGFPSLETSQSHLGVRAIW